MSGSPAVFLDRDGVINRLLYHKDAGIVDSPFTAAQFQVLPCVPKAIRLLNDLGLPVVIVSNQPGVAKEHFSPEVLGEFEKLLDAVARILRSPRGRDLLLSSPSRRSGKGPS